MRSRRRAAFVLTLSASAALHGAALTLAALAVGVAPGPEVLLDLVADVEDRAAVGAPAASMGPGPSAAMGRGGATGPRPASPQRATPPTASPSRTPERERAASVEPPSAPAPDTALPDAASGEATTLERREVESSVASAQAPPDPPRTVPAPRVEAAVSPPPATVRPGPMAESDVSPPSAHEGVAVSPGTSVASSHPGGAARGRGTTGGGRTGSPGGAERGDATLPGAGGSPAAPGSTGDGGGIPPEYDPYLQRFRHRVEESAGYPLAARREGLFGRVELEVLLDPSGRVSAVRVVRSSSHAVLDDAALDAVRSAEPEPFPAHLPRRPLRVRLPLAFELR